MGTTHHLADNELELLTCAPMGAAARGRLAYAKLSAPITQRDGALRRMGGSAPRPVASPSQTGSNQPETFASSLTLAISEVTARADIPFLTHSYADEITGRGLESVFNVNGKAGAPLELRGLFEQFLTETQGLE